MTVSVNGSSITDVHSCARNQTIIVYVGYIAALCSFDIPSSECALKNALNAVDSLLLRHADVTVAS